jgi:SAM-dependent methyltransferase
LLAGRGAGTVVGVDVSPEAIEWAKSHFVLPNLEFRLSDGQRLPLESESVDQVVSLETIEHVEDGAAFLVELARVLRPGGGLILSTPLTYGEARLRPANKYHLREYDDKELCNLMNPLFQVELQAGQHSTEAARYAQLRGTPGVGALIRAGLHRLLPHSVRQGARSLLSRAGGSRPPAWIALDATWRDAPVQIVVARKR